MTLPIIAPAVISGWLLSFTLSLDDLVIASFVTGPSSTTLPIKIFSSIRLGVNPEINALSTIMIGLVTVGVLVASLVSRQTIARREREALEANLAPVTEPTLASATEGVVRDEEEEAAEKKGSEAQA